MMSSMPHLPVEPRLPPGLMLRLLPADLQGDRDALSRLGPVGLLHRVWYPPSTVMRRVLARKSGRSEPDAMRGGGGGGGGGWVGGGWGKEGSSVPEATTVSPIGLPTMEQYESRGRGNRC